MTQCKACEKDIGKGVKKCVHCGKDQRNFFMRHKIFTGFLALILIVIVVSVNGTDNPEVADDNQDIEAEEKEPVNESENESEAEVEQEPEKEPEEDTVSREFKSALTKAELYANTMYMSKKGVYNQLVSEHGEGFPEDAAQYAIDNVQADWKENALNKATTYANEMAMSDSAVYDQLVSTHGEQFTEDEAQYAVDNLN